jgi:hypothetical protein
MAQLVVERLTNTKAKSYTNAAMQWGTDQEPFARAAYEAAQGVMVEEVGFVPLTPTIEWSGASPDGLVGDDGLVEIKCPETKGILLRRCLPKKSRKNTLPRCNFKWLVLVETGVITLVFDPRMPAKAQLFVTRVCKGMMKYIAEIEAEIVKFLAEVASQVQQL